MKKYLLFSLLFLACSKDKDDDKIDMAHFYMHKWKLDVISVKKADGTMQPDIYSSLLGHEKDNYFLFRSDKTYTYQDNSLRRPGGENNEAIDGGSLFFDNNTVSAVGQGAGFTGYHPGIYLATKIVALSPSIMKWESVDHQSGDITYTTLVAIP